MEIKSYIFLTNEGYTYSPSNDSSEPDIHNLQVIGFSKGKNPEDAFDKLIVDNPWLKESTFNSIFSYPMDNDYEKSMHFHTIHDILYRSFKKLN